MSSTHGPYCLKLGNNGRDLRIAWIYSTITVDHWEATTIAELYLSRSYESNKKTKG